MISFSESAALHQLLVPLIPAVDSSKSIKSWNVGAQCLMVREGGGFQHIVIEGNAIHS